MDNTSAFPISTPPTNGGSLDDYKSSEIDSLCKAIDNAVSVDDFSQAGRLLLALRVVIGNVPEKKDILANAEKQVDEYRQARVEKLLSEAQDRLGDPDKFDEGRIGALLDEVNLLAPQNPRSAQLRQEINQKAVTFHERKLYNKTRDLCSQLWAGEQELVQAHSGFDTILGTCYQPALSEAQQALGKYPTSALLQGLVNEAQREYDQAIARYEARSTADKTGNYKTLWEILDKETDTNKLIPWRDRADGGEHPVTVAEARRGVQKIAEDFAYNKALEYLNYAQQQMAVHNPRSAREWLTKGSMLFLIDNESKNRLAKYEADTVLPALHHLEEAERLLQQAVLEPSPEKAWDLADQAVQSFEWVDRVSDIRLAIYPRLNKEIDRLIQSAETALADINRLKEALNLAEKSLSLAKTLHSYAEQNKLVDFLELSSSTLDNADRINDQCKAEESLRQQWEAEAKSIDSLINTQPSQAPDAWRGFIKSYSEDLVARFPSLVSLRSRIEEITGAADILTRLETDFASKDPNRIRSSIADCKSTLSKPQNAGMKDQLVAMQTKLELRLDFISAQGIEDERRKLELYQRVASASGHPDSSNASEEARKIREAQQSEAEVNRALDDAAVFLGSVPPKPREAYQRLVPVQLSGWRKRDIIMRMDQARQAWRDELVASVNQELRTRMPDPRQLRILAQEIRDKLPEPRPIQTADEAEAKADAVEALLLEQQLSWDQAVEKWATALNRSPLQEEYKLGWRRARKHQAEDVLKRAPEKEGKELLDELNEHIPSDAEVWALKAEFYLRLAVDPNNDVKEQERLFGLSLDALEVAKRFLDQSIAGKSSSSFKVSLEKRLEYVSSTANRGQKIARTKRDIAHRLGINRSVADFTAADRAARTLCNDYPQDLSLRNWWIDFRDAVILTLTQHDSSLTDKQIWERFDFRSKILILDPNHALAQDLLRSAATQAMQLDSQLKATVKDRTGLMVNEVDDEKVIVTQMANAIQVQQRAQAMINILQQFSQHIVQQGAANVTALQDTLNTGTADLQRFINDLQMIQQLVNQAEGYLGVAKANDQWNNFDIAINEISRVGFGEHRTTRYLAKRKESVLEDRGRLLTMQSDLLEATRHEAFAEALKLMQMMQDMDGEDSYSFQSSTVFVTPSGVTIRNWLDLQLWLEERRTQLNDLADWMEQFGINWILQEDIQTAQMHQALVSDVTTVKWQEAKKKVRTYLECGNFNRAKEECQLALNGNDQGWYDQTRVVLSLIGLQKGLLQLPVLPNQALSNIVLILVRKTQEHLTKVAGDVADARNILEKVEDTRRAWISAQERLDKALKELGVIKAERPRLWAKTAWNEQVTKAKANVNAAIMESRSICPKHPDLANIENHALLTG